MPRKLKPKGKKAETKTQKELRELRSMEFSKEEKEKYKFISAILTASRIFTVEVFKLFKIKEQEKVKKELIELKNFDTFRFSSFLLNKINFPQELLLIKRFFKLLEKAGEENEDQKMRKALALSVSLVSEQYTSIFYDAYRYSIKKTIKFYVLDIKDPILQEQIESLISIMASMFVVRDFLTFKKDEGIKEVFTAKQLKELRSLSTQLTNRLGNILYRLSGDLVSSDKLVLDFNYYLEMEGKRVFGLDFKQAQGGKIVGN